MDSRIVKLAKLLVNYSCSIQPGEKVYIHYIGRETKALARQLVKEYTQQEAFLLYIIQNLSCKGKFCCPVQKSRWRPWQK